MFSKTSKNKKPRNKTIKKPNCHPAVKGKTVSQETCYTVPVLQKIRNEYNKANPSKAINTTDPNQLWHELKDRFFGCKKEDCWLKEIKDPQLRKQIDEEIFAPDHPSDWKKNPREWLSNYDITNVLKQYEKAYPDFLFFEPTPIDFDASSPSSPSSCVTEELCNFSLQKYPKKTKIAIIFNLDKHDEPGSHWVSLFLHLEEKFLLYFDSNGVPAPKEIAALRKRIVEQYKKQHGGEKLKLYTNRLQHQKKNTECGMYSLFVIVSLLTKEMQGVKYNNSKEILNKLLKKRIPDDHVFTYRNVFFNDGGEEK